MNIDKVRKREKGNIQVDVHRYKSEYSKFSSITVSIYGREVASGRVSPPSATMRLDGECYVNWFALGSQSVTATQEFIAALRCAIAEVKREAKWWGIEFEPSVQWMPFEATL